MAFTFKIRKEIVNRSPVSELSEDNDRPLECSHLNHHRIIEEYNSPEMGMRVTDIEHLAYHLIFQNNPKQIGLHLEENNWAIRELEKRVRRYKHISDEELERRLLRAKNFWFYYLNIEV